MNGTLQDLPDIVTFDEAMEALRLSRSTLNRRIRDKQIKSRKDGHLRRFRREWIIEYSEKFEKSGGLNR